MGNWINYPGFVLGHCHCLFPQWKASLCEDYWNYPNHEHWEFTNMPECCFFLCKGEHGVFYLKSSVIFNTENSFLFQYVF